MPVFNTAANQVLSQPVSNYYQGKAIRTQQKANEQAIEFNDLKMQVMEDELENAPSERKRAKEFAELQMDNIRGQIDERMRTGDIRELELNAKLLTPALVDYANAGDDDGALRGFNEAMKSILPNMSEESRQKYLEAAGPDHAFSHEEAMLVGLGVRSFMDAQKQDSPYAKINPKDYTSASLAKYEATRNVSDLVPVAVDGGADNGFAKPAIKDFTPDSIRTYLDSGNPADLVPREDGAKLSDRDKRIRDVKALGSSDAEAIDLVDKYISVTSSTDSGGNVTVTNTRTGKAYKISARKARTAGLTIPEGGEDIIRTSEYVGPRWSQPIALINPAPNIQESLITEAQRSMQEIDKGLVAGGLISGQDVMDASGVRNIAQRGLNNMGQLASLNSLPRYFQEETDARLKVMNFNQAVRSAVVISSKGAIWEQQKVEQMLPNPDSLIEDPVGAGIAYTRTMHWLSNQREAEVAMLEGRVPMQIPRTPLGVKDDPIIIKSEDEAEGLPKGTWVMLNGRLGEV